MVKKIIFFSTLLLITLIPNLNVKAIPLGYPTVWYRENGVAYQLSNVTRDTWYDTDVYVGSTIGRISSAVDITHVDFIWTNANLCSGHTINIKGSVFGQTGLFNENATLTFENNNTSMVCSNTVINGNQMNFSCYSDTGGGTLTAHLSTVVNYANSFRTAISRNIDVTCDVTNEAIVSQSIQNTQNIINNQNSNTNTIIQNQDTNTQDIINNQNTNTQDIINNQNTNTQQQIESEKVCKEYTFNNSVPKSDGYLNSSGNVISSTNLYHTTNYIPINKNETYFLDLNYSLVSSSYCLYDTDKNLLSCSPYNSRTSITIVPSSDGYIRYSLSMKESNYITTFRGNTCTNGNQALDDSINNLTDSITSEDSPNTNQDISDMNDMIASDTPITDLLTLPMTLINAYYTGITSSCSPYNFGSLLGTDIVFPCINLEQRLGSNLWLIIDSLCSIFLIYSIAMLFVHAFDSLTSLKDDFDDMYVPRHAGKHVGSGING